MPLQKREARDAPVSGRWKRQKSSDSLQQGGAAAAVDLTALNAASSPLLRLPPELRHQIWELAFGNRMIHVWSHNKYEDEEQLTQVFYIAHDAVCHRICGSPEWLSEMGRPEATQSHVKPQLVCRQLWAETSEVFLSSCTFRVSRSEDFRAWALSGHNSVPRVRRLLVHLSGGKSHNFPMYSHADFTSSLVGRFSSLEGVVFTGSVYWGPREAVLNADVMGGDHWRMIHIPVIIRAFQQHKLKEELTHVTMLPKCYSHDVWDTKPYNEAIRKALLQHHPRRLSKRRA
ncbi:uncharacterized protein M421DRAFT_174719 [Didymella exigua CBS 183.55]|uniref:DUF7730 domain-containing protein n=1 Tax=Didymella exigua CBS 183.55 TaxID=1150837 RepID=A0A6A5RLA4_9PLEO|nr:uncharacterized protein M421DRAFT_174719 [Didymella exigua CBS 183.55]KAF1927754.1 hypothetical protein M421DRAFT_174719 [Didymella exigua CBS 183.55]